MSSDRGEADRGPRYTEEISVAAANIIQSVKCRVVIFLLFCLFFIYAGIL